MAKTLIAVSIPTVVVLAGLLLGWTQSAYELLWTNTAGEPYTYIMRRNPLLLFLPSLAVLAVLGASALAVGALRNRAL